MKSKIKSTQFNKFALIYTTVGSLSDAESLAEKAVTSKNAACVNIMPSGLSVYEWEGKLEKSQECYVLFKTSLAKADALYGWLLANHPYSCPVVVKMSADTSPDFLGFVEKSVLV